MGVFYLVYCFDALLSMVLKSAALQRLDLAILSTNPLLNVVVNLALIPQLGAVGAAIGQLAGGLCTSTLRYAFANWRVGRPGWMTLAAPWAVLSLSFGAAVMLWGGVVSAWCQLLLYGL
ncbi:unnamed protein product, partial [Phaeothamnion confervicola]